MSDSSSAKLNLNGASSGASPLAYQFEQSTTPRRKVLLYIGTDVTALGVANKIIPELLSKDFQPVLCLARHPKATNPDSDLPVGKRFKFYERHLLNNVVIPFMDEKKPRTTKKTGEKKPLDYLLYTPNHLQKLYGIQVVPVSNVNDPKYVQSIIDDPLIVGAVSIRCYQKFRQPIIDAFNNKVTGFDHEKPENPSGFLWNIHPGPLPQRRGVYASSHAVANRDKKYAWSMHEVDEDFDTGDLIDTTDWQTINYNAPVINLHTDFIEPAADLFLHHFETLVRYSHVSAIQQNENGANYDTYPTEQQYREWAALNPPVNYISPEGTRNFYVSNFVPERGKLAQRFNAVVNEAIAAYEQHGQSLAYPGDFPQFSEKEYKKRTTKQHRIEITETANHPAAVLV